MSRRRHQPRHHGVLYLSLTAALWGMAAPAAAAPPTEADFQITYWTSNEDGERSRQMTQNDLQGYVNKARCECGQSVSARVRIQSAAAVDNVRVRTYVGNNCDAGQLGNTEQNRPCALVLDEFANAYTKNIDFEFNPLWLASGVSRDSETQAIDTAIAHTECGVQEGTGGVWICVENGTQTDCQPEEFIVRGAQTNIVDPETGTTQSLSYDFNPPNSTATGFTATGGDSSIVIEWDNTSTAATFGYRVLCANADGSPVDGQGFELSSVTRENRGTVYYTGDNLCPEGPFDEVDVDDLPDNEPVFPTTDDGTGGETDGDSDGDSFGTDSAGMLGASPDISAHHGTDCCTSGTCEDYGCELVVRADCPSCDPAQWTQACADQAAQSCTSCGGAGYCCAANSTSGCSDSACEQSVCDEPGFEGCCTVEWTNACADQAKLLCADVCGEGTGGPAIDQCEAAQGSDTMSVPGTTQGATGNGTGTDGETDTDTDGDTDGALANSPINSLDYAYICSDYIGFSANSARIKGLKNDQEYQLLVVAFDRAGNPQAVSEVLTAEPRETTDLWEQCDAQGEVCGTGGFCSCTQDPTPPGSEWLVLVGMFGLLARRRRSA